MYVVSKLPSRLSVLTLITLIYANKTKLMLFSRSRNIDPENLSICTLEATQTEQVPHDKYLGIWIDDKL